jgi:hypothetical protein
MSATHALRRSRSRDFPCLTLAAGRDAVKRGAPPMVRFLPLVSYYDKQEKIACTWPAVFHPRHCLVGYFDSFRCNVRRCTPSRRAPRGLPAIRQARLMCSTRPGRGHQLQNRGPLAPLRVASQTPPGSSRP